MKYLLLSGFFPPPVEGGAQRLMYEVFRRFPVGEVTVLTWKPYEVTSLPARYRSMKRGEGAPGGLEPPMSNGLHIIRRRYIAAYVLAATFCENATFRRVIKGVSFLLWLAELSWYCWRSRPEAIYCEGSYPTGVLGLLAKRWFGIPFLVFVYGEELQWSTGPQYGRRVIDKVLHRADHLIAISSFTAALLKNRGIPETKVSVVNPGVDTEEFRPGISSDLRARYGLTGAKVLLTVGRPVERKGHALVMEAMHEVLRVVPEARYVVVGPLVESLKEMVERQGLAQYVTLVGHADNLPAWYCASDLFVLANHENPADRDVEGFGMVFIEAGSCGKAVVGGRSGGAVDAVADGESGLLVNATNITELSGAIARVLMDAGLSGRLGVQGRERAVRLFSWDVTAEKVRAAGKAAAGRARYRPGSGGGN